ncbi:MAG: NAD-dependent epimerase/dehydratase family protein [Halanaeroarchaeum sp.]
MHDRQEVSRVRYEQGGTAESTGGVSDPLEVAVTGAAGYIGSAVVNLFRKRHPEWSITALDNFYRGDVRQIGDVAVDHVDVRHRDRLETALAGSDVVVHLAAISGVDDCRTNPDLAHEVNVLGTANVAWFCRKHGAALAFPFSMAVLGDPASFPVTVEQPRDPMNWYGRTKVLGEELIETYADGAFPAHLFMKSNLYGEHVVGESVVSKGTVINFFVGRALEGEPMTVYEPGTQARNYLHVEDVALLYLKSVERFATQLADGETGVERYAVGSDEDPSVMAVAETVQDVAASYGSTASIELVENPRADDETLVESFGVDASGARETLGWRPERTIRDAVEEAFERELDD